MNQTFTQLVERVKRLSLHENKVARARHRNESALVQNNSQIVNTHMPESTKGENSTDLTKSFLRFLEPATILTVTIGAVYYLGWQYVDGYFRRIGINHLSLTCPLRITSNRAT